jgi:hypothetical protein
MRMMKIQIQPKPDLGSGMETEETEAVVVRGGVATTAGVVEAAAAAWDEEPFEWCFFPPVEAVESAGVGVSSEFSMVVAGAWVRTLEELQAGKSRVPAPKQRDKLQAAKCRFFMSIYSSGKGSRASRPLANALLL